MRKNNVCFCDFHTHILPHIDDGAETVDISIKLIDSEIKQGVRQICLTPHFKNQCSIESFLNVRNNSYNEMISALKSIFAHEKLPDFHMGAEVLLDENTAKVKNLDALCFNDTNLLLLEPIHGFWGDWILKVVFQIIAENNVQIVIAHADRYTYNKSNIKILEKLIEMDCLLQFNVYNLKNRKVRYLIKKILSNGSSPLIGSDAHDIETRPVKMSKINGPLVRLLYGKNFIDIVNNKTNSLLKKST